MNAPPPSTQPGTPMAPFFTLWGGQALSLLASNAVQFALIWWLTARTGSAAVLAGATFLGILPQVALGPFIGALVDRWNRKRILLLSDAAVAAASALLALLFLLDLARIEHVLTLLLARALGNAFHGPAMAASTTLMVPRQHLTRIQGLNQSLQGGQLIVSAPLGALLFGVLPMPGVMAVDVITALFAIVPLLFVRVPQPDRDASAAHGKQSMWRDVLAGLRYLRNLSGHLALLALAGVVNLCMVPAFTLLPLLVVAQGGEAAHLGWMNSAFGAGTIAGGIILGAWGGFKTRIYTTFVGLIGIGVSTLLLGYVSSFGLAMAAISGVGVMMPLTNGPIMAVLQATVTPGFQGRVFTLYTSLASLAAPLGLAAAAPVADLLGVRVWYAAGGVACLTMGVIGFFVPSIAHIEAHSQRA